MTKKEKPKPETKTTTYHDYQECSEYLEEKYGYCERDFKGHFRQDQVYIKETGDVRPEYAGAVTKEGKAFNYKLLIEDLAPHDNIAKYHIAGKTVTKEEAQAQERLTDQWRARFEKWRITNPQPEYCDFWHWVTDHHEIHNGCSITFHADVLEGMKDENGYNGPDEPRGPAPEWVQTIYGYYIKEFANESGELEMWVEW